MSRRFNDEPINLIRRIPSPEQLSSARPTKPSLGQKLMETGAAVARSAMELFAQPARQESSETVPAEEAVSHTVPEAQDHHDHSLAEESDVEHAVPQQTQVVMPFVQQPTESTSSSAQAGTHVEEVAELRVYLLRQQQDIARLAEQVQELKSVVVSQRQMLAYLGKELESSSLSRMTGSIASAVAKPNRSVRQKGMVKAPEIKAKAVAQDNDPMLSSRNL
ncbi:MAG: hypothetical protein HP494_13575 [Nitrospira sp.]|nr:hypothetical protein [Nitrospira sp.]